MATLKEKLREQALELELEIEGLTSSQLQAAIESAEATASAELVQNNIDSALLGELQEKALTLGLSIYTNSDVAEALTADVLETAINAKEAELKADSEAEETEAEEARDSARQAESQVAAVQAKRDAAAARAMGGAAATLHSDRGLGSPSKADIALAETHGYPVVIPGAKAYRTRISFHCSYGGGLRLAKSIVLLTDAHAKNKLEYLTLVS